MSRSTIFLSSYSCQTLGLWLTLYSQHACIEATNQELSAASTIPPYFPAAVHLTLDVFTDDTAFIMPVTL